MDAVEGRTPDDDAVDRESASDINCSPCSDVKATAFCVECHDYLCTSCSDYHQKLGITKTHTLLTGDNMPRQPSNDASDVNMCSDHPNEKIEFYCMEDKALSCGSCNSLKHEECEIHNITDIADAFKAGTELSQLNMDILSSCHMIVQSMANIDACLKSVDTLKCDELTKLKEYRARINEYLDKREMELQTETKEIRDTDIASLQELQANLKTCQSTLNDLRVKLKSPNKDACELFIAAKRICVEMTKLQSDLNDINTKISFKHYTISPNLGLETIVKKESGLASIETIEGMIFCYFSYKHT